VATTHRPDAVVLTSPWLDLSNAGASRTLMAGKDAVLDYNLSLGRAARAYAGHADLTRPDISPLYAPVPSHKLAILLLSGSAELLLSDTIRLQRKLRDAGWLPELSLWDGEGHSFWLNADPAAQHASQEIGQFLTRTLPQGSHACTLVDHEK